MSATRPEINLHPTSLQPSSLKSKSYDLVVIGGGSAGEMTAARATRCGLTALIIESELVGGECPYWACVPSKALLRPAETLESAKAVGGAKQKLEKLGEKYGLGRSQVDLEGVWARRDFFAKGWNDQANVKLMSDFNVDIVRGFGRVAGVKKASVQAFGSDEKVEIEAKHAIAVCTGSDPVIPDIPGLMESKPWTPREAVSAKEVPKHLIVIGAGPVGCELATIYQELGSKVTLITQGSHLLANFEPEAGKRVRQSLVKSGVDVMVSTKITNVSRDSNGGVVLTLPGNNEIRGSEVLIATGRKARTTDLGLESIGLPGNGAHIKVDYSMCAVSVAEGWLYSVGDTNGVSPLTHMGKYQGKIAGDTIGAKAKGSFGGQSSKSYSKFSIQASVVPQVIFTAPQVASVGLTKSGAKASGRKVKLATVKMVGPGTFLHAEGYDGWAQWVVEESSGRLLGATFVGRDVVDLLHASTVAIVGKMTVEQLWHAVPSFPTMSEVYTSLLDACGL